MYIHINILAGCYTREYGEDAKKFFLDLTHSASNQQNASPLIFNLNYLNISIKSNQMNVFTYFELNMWIYLELVEQPNRTFPHRKFNVRTTLCWYDEYTPHECWSGNDEEMSNAKRNRKQLVHNSGKFYNIAFWFRTRFCMPLTSHFWR